MGQFSNLYNFDIVYRPGKEDIVFETLSRALLVYETQETGKEECFEDRHVAKMKNRIFVPREQREFVMNMAHRTPTSHLKANKLIMFLRSR